MVRELLQRPSVIVGAWTLAVVAVFVWRGDLRVTHAQSGGPPAPDREPVVVRRPPNEPKVAPLVQRPGRVFDALGYLVVGAEVVPMERPATRSDSDGAFTLAMAPSSCLDVLVRADGQQPVWVRASEGSPDVLAVPLLPKAPWDRAPTPPASLPTLRGEGTVRTADGQPLADAFVTTVGGVVWARTDDIGRFTLPLATPTTELLVHDPEAGIGRVGLFGRSAPFTCERTNGAVPLPDVVATSAIGLRGIVRDARGEPVVGLPVEVRGEPLSRVVETGAGGAFRIGGLLPGRYDVRPFAFRGGIGMPHVVTLVDRHVDVDLQLVAVEEVRVRVVDERGAPVPGVFVASSVGGARRGVARADAAGRAAVPVAVATEFEVRRSENFAAIEVRRYEPEPATLVVALP